MAARRCGEEEVHEGFPQGDQVSIVGQGNEVTVVPTDMNNG